MRLVFLQLCYSILTILLPMHAVALYVKPILERTSSGNLTLINCRRHTESLITHLEALPVNLEPALLDLDNPSDSPAFAAFFKDTNHAPFVRHVLQNITTGAPSPAFDDRAIYPSIVCLDGPGQVNSTELDTDMYLRCQHPEGPFASILFESPENPTITICPRFFKLPTRPPRSKRACLELGYGGQYFMSDGQSLIYSQTLTLMHELAHMYLYWTLGSKMDVYHVEQCLGLPAGKTVANVQNYVYYAANVMLGCTKFPVRPHPPRRGHNRHRGDNVTAFDLDAPFG